jgi:polyphosphate kinase 2 (PPK2 family)
VARLDTLQERLYAQGQYALLLIFQGMDGAGKDSTIRHVMSGVSPQSTDVHAFKQPSAEELDHDYLWRAVNVLPGRGHIGIFNRSYYEDVLVVRVHPALLEAQKLPRPLITARIWKERFEDINALERHLSRNGTIVRKFYLHISRREQRRRLLERLDDPEKHWKFSDGRSRRASAVEGVSRRVCRCAGGNQSRSRAVVHHPCGSQMVRAGARRRHRRRCARRAGLSLPEADAQRRRDLANARRQLLRGE